ncbi:hypothetical protein MRB53_040625 [Persea americana]|nr:hypothetical protein MRB53_040625 [Persea americana]
MQETQPDFTVLSFYKIFGLPDLGALVVRKQSGHILQWRKYFGGGTVDLLTCVDESWHMRKDYAKESQYSLHVQLEDGTLPFHSIIALEFALQTHATLYGSMSSISRHTAMLTKRMFDGLASLVHYNGRRVCRIYNDTMDGYGDARKQGAVCRVQRATR